MSRKFFRRFMDKFQSLRKEQSIRSALKVGLVSGVVGLVNGVWVILAGTSSFYQFSPYSWIFGAMLLVVPTRVVDSAEDFLFRSGMQLILAPVLGVLLGAVIGRVVSRFNENLAASFLAKTGAITGGIAGLFSLGIIFLNIYAS